MEINYLAVLVAGIASMFIGAIWYSPKVFGNMWMHAIGMTAADGKKMQEKGMGLVYLLNFLSMLIFGYVLAHFINGLSTQEAIVTGCWAWLGFIVPLQLGQKLWENRSWSLFIVNIAYWLVTMVVMAAIIGAWV